MSEVDPVMHFEQLMEQLREQVTLLEQHSLSLSDAIGAYKRSVDLANACHRLLDDAQLRIESIDQSSHALQESNPAYRAVEFDVARLLLGDDEEDLLDLLDDE